MPEMSRMVEIWIFVGLGVMVVLFLMSGNGQALSQSGAARGTHRVRLGRDAGGAGHGTLCCPWCRICRDLSLELMSFDVAPQQDLYTKQGVAVTVESRGADQGEVRSRVCADRGPNSFLTKSDQGARRLDPPGHGRPPARHPSASLRWKEIVKAAGRWFSDRHARNLRRKT